ncbi:MAG: helix-turn-helix transcriptional regulator [Spirochaetales bacterium]|nr:helix-turn-helix transcriptional regulator [Spirochaetales bacterium]
MTISDEQAARYAQCSVRLRHILAKKGMKQQDLADRCGINKTSISQYAKGILAPSVKHAKIMAKVLKVSPAWLMGLTDDVPEVFVGLENDRQIIDFVGGYTDLSDEEKTLFWQTLRKLVPKN